MDKPRRFKRTHHVEYGEHCFRCATALPVEATVCTVCGVALTIPVQLPAPRQVAA